LEEEIWVICGNIRLILCYGPKHPEQKILELEGKVRLLEENRKLQAAEHLASGATKKGAIIFDMLVDMAEKEYDIPNQKKIYTPGYSTHYKKIQRNVVLYL